MMFGRNNQKTEQYKELLQSLIKCIATWQDKDISSIGQTEHINYAYFLTLDV